VFGTKLALKKIMAMPYRPGLLQASLRFGLIH
jgi:hypothetical protein